MSIKKIIKNSVLLTIVLMVICGLIYPGAITVIGQVLFNHQANGSLVAYNGKTVGSELLGQNFTDLRFFHGRISSVNYNTYEKKDTLPAKGGKAAYTGVASGSQNLGPSNKVLIDRVKNDMAAFIKEHPTVKKQDIPTDLLTSSGSGLDPEISVKAAEIQIPLIAEKTGISEKKLNEIVASCTRKRTFGIFGEEGVNVLKANIEISKNLK